MVRTRGADRPVATRPRRGPEGAWRRRAPSGEASRTVRSLDAMPGPWSARLSALGLVPGVAVTLRQRRPVPVVRVGLTDIAVSDEILAQILVADAPATG